MGLRQTLEQGLRRARYAAGQGSRVAFYGAHYLAARRMSAGYTRPGEPAFRPRHGTPDPFAVRRAFLQLFAEDRKNIENGLYPAPKNELAFSRLANTLRNSTAFFRDLPAVDARRIHRNGTEARDEPGSDRYPTYYRQNFHYQSGGWLTEDSAALYDTQVEILFTGAAGAMRRAALAEIAREIRGLDQRQVSLLDLACGTGAFLAETLRAYPKLKASGLELSAAYAEKAREQVRNYPGTDIIEGPAEAMPLADEGQDIIVSIYLFHELPPKIRREVAREIARVLKPGGVFVFADSLQTGDTEGVDGMLEYFPEGFHEPYYTSYLTEDFGTLFGDVELVQERSHTAFLTKVTTWRKPS